MKNLLPLLIAGSLLLVDASEVAAQGFQGGLRGAVRDPNGVIPGATVTITNEATNIKRTSTTNEVGEYAFTNVTPGTYTLTVAIPGYKTFESKGLRIGTQTFITTDVTLEVGAIEESITVTGRSPVIETSNASSGAVLDSKALEVLPSPGRAAFLIGVSVPTVIPSGDAQFNRQQDQTNASLLSLGGGARRANSYTVDGVPITDLRNRASANPTIEALEEVKVQVHTYDAEMGRTGGGVFNSTAKSGTNELRGTGFYQTRPNKLLAKNYFDRIFDRKKPTEPYYHLWGSGVGGPIIPNRTFFWGATEGYRSITTRNGALIFPTDLERRGDFSQTFNRQNQLMVIYDPLTTRPDPSNPGRFIRDPIQCGGRMNVICPERINPVAANITRVLPAPDENVSNQQVNFRRTALIQDTAEMYTGKVEHKFTDKVSLTGFYLYNNTDEPCADYWEPGLNGANRFGDPLDYLLKRRVHILALNNTNVISDSTVASLRFGWTRFVDDDTLTLDFDPATLGFSPSFISALRLKKFPFGDIEGYGDLANGTFGALPREDRNWYSWGFNGAVTRLVGTHTFKMGADFRHVGLNFFSFGQSSGEFNFDRLFTSADPFARTATSGNGFASFLLGYPTGDPGDLSFIPIANPLEVFTRYYGAYFQDDFRVGSNFTLNYGVRLEHEQGLMEKEDRFTVAFDQNAISPLNSLARLPDGREIRGGLVYAGQNGAPRHQGDPPAVKASPRVGAVWILNDETVLRAGYGIFWAPWNYQSPSTVNYGQIGYVRRTFTPQDASRPTVTLDNPFPNGVLEPVGNSLGPLTGVGGVVDFIDQNKKAPRVQQYSVDVQRELTDTMSVSVGYMGARGDDLNLGGSADATININQLELRHLTLGEALLEPVPNPFFGVPQAGPLATRETLQRRQLLRPFPQFLDVFARQVTAGKSRYHAVVTKLERRVSNGWGGRFSYTWSRLNDNQFGEGNHYVFRGNVSSERSYPVNSYDLEAEYSRSVLDVPHRFVLAPIVELPFGSGKKWLTGPVGTAFFGGWTISAVAEWASGFPVNINQNNENAFTFGGQRPNRVPGADPKTPGDALDRLNNWINTAAFSDAARFTLGNAPRTDTRVRTPDRWNLDAVFAKDIRLQGSTRAQVRIEMLNLTNTPKFRGFEQRFGRTGFGQITRQSGFTRIAQLSFRLSF